METSDTVMRDAEAEAICAGQGQADKASGRAALADDAVLALLGRSPGGWAEAAGVAAYRKAYGKASVGDALVDGAWILTWLHS